jgi:parallel beta-helix repeat protein/predicted outer membrane repeat protein
MGGSPWIEGNLIADNIVTFGSGGGAILSQAVNPFFEGNRVIGNQCKFSGGGLYCTGGEILLANNIVSGNTAELDGGGIFCHFSGNTLLMNNTVADNAAGTGGGGMVCNTAAWLRITNTILYGNQAPEGPELWLGPSVQGLIEFSDLSGGAASVHLEPGSHLDWAQGMIDEEPALEDPQGGDYHLSWLSPCINRGTATGVGGYDVDGDDRMFMGAVDMGADEHTGTHTLSCDAFQIYVSKGAELHLELDMGRGNGGRPYMIFASLSGTAPGTPLPGGNKMLPINWDPFTDLVIHASCPPSRIFVDFQGRLDRWGRASAVLDTNGPVAGIVGSTISLAYALPGPPWYLASNPIQVMLVP